MGKDTAKTVVVNVLILPIVQDFHEPHFHIKKVSNRKKPLKRKRIMIKGVQELLLLLVVSRSELSLAL